MSLSLCMEKTVWGLDRLSLLFFSPSVMSDSFWLHGCSTPGSSVLHCQSLLEFMSVEFVMLSNHLILCCPLLFLPSIFPSTRVFSNESALRLRWPIFKLDRLSNTPRTQHSQVWSPYFQLVRVTHLCLLSGLWSHLNFWLLCFLFCLVLFRYSGLKNGMLCFFGRAKERIYLCRYWALVLIIRPLLFFFQKFSPSQIVGACLPSHHSYSLRIAHCVCLPVTWRRGDVSLWAAWPQGLHSTLIWNVFWTLPRLTPQAGGCASASWLWETHLWPSCHFPSSALCLKTVLAALGHLSSSTGCPGGKSGLLLARVLHIFPSYVIAGLGQCHSKLEDTSDSSQASLQPTQLSLFLTSVEGRGEKLGFMLHCSSVFHFPPFVSISGSLWFPKLRKPKFVEVSVKSNKWS